MLLPPLGFPFTGKVNGPCHKANGWKEISRVKRARFTLNPALGKALKHMVEGET
jgi:hypothetical protein